MKNDLSGGTVVKYLAIMFVCVLMLHTNITYAQTPATITIPVGIGNPCNASGSDSLKYYNYNDVTNVLSHRWNCKPSLAIPPGQSVGFTDNLSTIQFNPFDGYLYYGRIVSTSGQYTTYIYRWLPTVCPTGSLPIFQTFDNQLVVGIEFDPVTGYGYQINFVDTTGVPALNYDNTGDVGTFVSGTIVNGRPASAHYDDSNDDLQYSRANDVQGVSWAAPIKVATAGNVGQHPSLAIVNGNPAIAYHDITNSRLMYVRATNVNGTAWGTPVVVDDPPGTTNAGQYTSLVVINGNPAVAYYDVSNGDLKYNRATDANGAAWGTPQILDATGTTGQFTSMEIVNGNPAISYYDGTNTDLRYIRATNANGTAWAAPVTVTGAGTNTGQYTSMKVVNGNPAISFYNSTDQDLVYVRATDANGTAWAAIQNLAATGNVGLYTSMAIVNGNPAISFQDGGNSDLKFIRATDASGTTWAPVETPEATGTRGAYSNLMVADGNPAIAYYDGSNTAARFIRSYDNIGDHWFTNTGVYDMELQQVDFSTNTLGPSRKINFGTRYIYRQSGDVVMTPSRQMLAAFDNKYFTINWQDYPTATPLVATFIDTLMLGTGNNLVGLAFASGKLVGSVRASSMCNSFHRELDILTGALSPITSTDNFTSADMTNIPTGVGAAKRLVSTTLVSTGTYDVVYELVIRNYGGTPISNIQVYDTLNNINGLSNNISASITSFSGPAGINPNPSYNGRTSPNFNLLVPGSTLSNIPGQNTITIRITCRISGILPGVVYNNSAAVSGTNIFGDNVRDVSTNGSNPDLNSNDKPDDVGENQPTPLLITVPAITPPCATLVNVLYSQDFGTGTGLVAAIPGAVLGPNTFGPALATSLYTSSTTAPLATERYTITNNANNANTTHFLSMPDHTGNANGRMLVVNADAANTIMYRGSFYNATCINTQYSLSFYAAFPGNAAYQTICNAFGGFQYPRIRMRIRDGSSGLIITETSTTDITTSAWNQYGVRFVAPASYSQIIFELINDAPGGCGNDVLIDDIQFGTCDPTPTVSSSVAAGCMGQSATFTSTITDPGAIGGTVQYQWQVANTPTGPWSNILLATGANHTIAAVAAADTGKYYRVLIAANGNIGNANCRFASAPILLQGRILSTAPTSISRNKNNICPGISVTLTRVGGTLGDGASWQWYTGNCNGTYIGTGNSITVTPLVNTTYYVKAVGTCNTTTCAQITIFISCDIDKDKDGITDYVESYAFPAALTNAYNTGYPGYKDNNNDFINDDFQADGDSDNDATPNYLDTDFPGRVDVNSDGIDDRFDMDLDGIINMLDLDSDNDGIPDVVEAGGVDEDGDGRLDNFTDTDGDGLSQSVDGNNTGAANSGNGLGAVDLDADGRPNAVDRDSDGDGIPDVIEVYGPDTNNDARIDGFVDVNGDGLHDAYINGAALLRTGADVNNDGRADSYPNKNFDNDRRANPYDIDSDGDGIADVIEAGFADANYNGFEDAAAGIGTDGWSNTIRARPAPLALLNSDGVGRPNYLDIDSDGDGIPDNIEGQSTAGYRFPAYADSDNDGLDNAYDLAPFTATFGGAGILLYDRDMDGIPDYIDLDADADGQPDIVEGNDWNFDGFAWEVTTPLGTDADGDGLDDRFDLINSTTNLKGTSLYMGTSGSMTGDPSPGTRATVQRTLASGGCAFERDWRCVSVVLPISHLQLNAADNNNVVALNWTVMTSIDLNIFEIERSTDNVNFQKAGTKDAAVTLDQMESFNSNDNIATISSAIIYYRIKAIAQNGQVKYSNVVAIRKGKSIAPFTISPNPANDMTSIRFYSEKEMMVTVVMRDYAGRQVYLQKVKALKGNNILPITNLTRYSDGVYHVQLMIDNDVQSAKLIIQN